MEFKLTEENAKILLRLVYLGNVVVNGSRQTPLAAYNVLAEKMYTQYLAATDRSVKVETTDRYKYVFLHPRGNEVADLCDRIYDEVSVLLKEHERAVVRERFEEIFRKNKRKGAVKFFEASPARSPRGAFERVLHRRLAHSAPAACGCA